MNKNSRVLSREEFEVLRENREPLPYAPDWQVTKVIDHGPGEYYRYSVEGFNLNYEPDSSDYRFSWHVPDLDWRFFFGKHYYSVLIPWSDTPTEWHPTEKAGPFQPLSRGVFATEQEAHAWATEKLNGQPYWLKAYQAAEYAD